MTKEYNILADLFFSYLTFAIHVDITCPHNLRHQDTWIVKCLSHFFQQFQDKKIIGAV